MQRKKILLVGGGSGGHFYPLIAIAEHILQHPEKPTLYYAGPTPYEKNTLDALGIRYIHVSAGKRRKYASLQNFFDLFKTMFGVCVALVKLYIIYPDVIVSKGSYTSVPIVIAGVFLRIPIIIHESDAKIGSANNFALRFARVVCITFESLTSTLQHKNIILTGIPIRRALKNIGNVHSPTGELEKAKRPTLLVLGGSQGAERINTLILDSLDELVTTYDVLHQTGALHYNEVVRAADVLLPNKELRSHYMPIGVLSAEQLNTAYNEAQVVITRAGSTSLYEIALHEKPSIIIPIPEEVSHDQRTNAYAYARTGAGVVIEEENLKDTLLRSEIDRIMNDGTLYNQMVLATRSFVKSDATDRISTIISEIAEKH